MATSIGGEGGPGMMKGQGRRVLEGVKRVARTVSSKHFAKDVGLTVLKSLPAVLLGMLLNILDGVSCE